jgi:hypothetical protein
VACRGSAAEALPGAVSPFFAGDRIRFSGELMAKDEFADHGAFGDATDLGDIGVQRGHPGQFGIVHAVAQYQFGSHGRPLLQSHLLARPEVISDQ